MFLKETRKGSPGGTSGKEPTYQCRRCKIYGFNPWVRRIPWRRAVTHSNILTWGIPWTEEPGRLTVHRVTTVGHDLAYRQEGIMKLLCPHGASISGEAIITSGPGEAEGRGPYQNLAIALEERFQPLPPGKERARSTGLSVVFLPPPVPCRGCHWPNPAPSRVQLHQTLRQARRVGLEG